MKKNLSVVFCLAGAALAGTYSLAAATVGQAVSTPVAAYLNPNFVIPGIGHLDGAGGSHWSSSIQATNHDSAAATLTACYTPNTTPTQGSCLTISLGPGQAVTLDDIVGLSYQLPGTFGLFKVNTGTTDPVKIEVTGDTLNKITDPASPINGGTIGTGMRALAPTDLLHTDGIPIFLPTSGTSSTQRQNLNWYSTTGGTATVMLFDHVGVQRGITTISVDATSRQAPLYGGNGLFNVVPQDNDYLEITLDNNASTTPAMLGASLAIVNNDPLNSVTIVLPTKLTNATNRLYILGAGKLPGANGTFFTTNLQVQNLSHSSVNGFNMYFYPTGQGNPNPVNTSDILINNEVKTYPDVTTTLFALPTPNLGALYIDGLDQPLLANATINNSVIRNGTNIGQVGMTFAGVTLASGALSKYPTTDNPYDQISNTINGIVNNAATRTNLGFVNTSRFPERGDDLLFLDPIPITVMIFDGSTGTPVTAPNNPYHLNLRPQEHLQVPLTAIIGDQALANGYAVVTPDDYLFGRVAILTYGVRVDNISGQGIVLPGQPLNTTPPPPQYEMKAQLFVIDSNGTLLETENTTMEQRLMQILYGSTTLDPFLGTKVYGNLTPAFQSLQDTINSITLHFSDADYMTAFGDTKANIMPYFIDTDGDGWCIDILPNHQDWQFDDSTPQPGNNLRGTYSLQLSLTKK